MKKGAIWAGIGMVFAVAVSTGYAPDFMLGRELRAARQEGLLSLPPAPTIAPESDAASAYRTVRMRHADEVVRLGNDFARQVRRMSPQTVEYLNAMAAASERPQCSETPDRNVEIAARALVIRATDEADLAAAARIARHLRSQDDLLGTGRWASLTLATLDREKSLGLGSNVRRRLVALLGSPLSPREVLRRHVARNVAAMESEKGSVRHTQRRVAYLRFWREFFRDAPKGGAAFLDATRKAESEIRLAEKDSQQEVDLATFTGNAKEPWTTWAIGIDRANARVEAER